ncbi:MAG: hypothetical protein KDD69_09130 [Bdellovibrionales bacterium]|nr:hypothetical protein [Bdellovibrionales bacterium]
MKHKPSDTNNKFFSYLEFGSICLESQSKHVWDFRLHETAYDWFMLARYANDMQAYEELIRVLRSGRPPASIELVSTKYAQEIHHSDDLERNLSKVIALALLTGNSERSFYELGHTLFGCIEGMSFLLNLLESLSIEIPPLCLQDVRWYGRDISALFNSLAIKLHSNFSVRTSQSEAELPSAFDVFFAKGVTLLYATENPDQLFSEISKGTCALFDYSFPVDEQRSRVIGTGKKVTHVCFHEFADLVRNAGLSFYLNNTSLSGGGSEQMVSADCLVGPEQVCRRFIEVEGVIHNKIRARIADVPQLRPLFPGISDSGSSWGLAPFDTKLWRLSRSAF